MYELFDDEKRALFRDAVAYAVITDLWTMFSEYLSSMGKRYNSYGAIRLDETYSIKPHRWSWKTGGSCGQRFRYHTGMVVMKHRRFWFPRRILYLDLFDVRALSSCPPRQIIKAVPSLSCRLVICGMDLDCTDEFSVVARLVRERTVRDVESATKAEVDRLRRLKERLLR